MSEFPKLKFPAVLLPVREKDGKSYIPDRVRGGYLLLTPEEWVRQHFVHFLVEHKGYPASLMANEVALTLNGTSRRCDTVLYDRTLSPRMIIEYKAPHIPITQKVFDQISRYNLVFRVDYLIVSNGLSHYCCRMDYARQSYQFLTDVPGYSEL